MADISSSLVLSREPIQNSHVQFSARCAMVCARAHPYLPEHLGIADSQGELLLVKLTASSRFSHVTARFQLHLAAEDGVQGLHRPVRKEWAFFEFHEEDGIILVQRGTNRLLFAQLPLMDGESSSVFLFGSHQAPISALAKNRRYLLSGACDACISLWDMDTGALIDSQPVRGAQRVSAVTFAGPMMVAAGTDNGDVVLLDISMRMLQPVQRFHADAGPITAITARLTAQQLYELSTASGPRGLDGGGVVDGPMGLPWRLQPYAEDAQAGMPKDTLLAVASDAGWLAVYQPVRAGQHAWEKMYVGSATGCPLLAFSPDGSHLALASGVGSGVVTLMQVERGFQAVKQYSFPSPLAGLGFLVPGASLTAMQADLAAALQLSIYAAPAREMPVSIQAVLPLHTAAEAELAAPREQLEAWAQRAAAPVPTYPGIRTTPMAASPGREMLSPIHAHAVAAAGGPSAAAAGRDGGNGGVSAVSDAGGSSEGGHGAVAACMLPESSAGEGARAWQGLVPSTLPGARSWRVGAPPPQPADLGLQPHLLLNHINPSSADNQSHGPSSNTVDNPLAHSAAEDIERDADMDLQPRAVPKAASPESAARLGQGIGDAATSGWSGQLSSTFDLGHDARPLASYGSPAQDIMMNASINDVMLPGTSSLLHASAADQNAEFHADVDGVETEALEDTEGGEGEEGNDWFQHMQRAALGLQQAQQQEGAEGANDGPEHGRYGVDAAGDDAAASLHGNSLSTFTFGLRGQSAAGSSLDHGSGTFGGQDGQQQQQQEDMEETVRLLPPSLAAMQRQQMPQQQPQHQQHEGNQYTTEALRIGASDEQARAQDAGRTGAMQPGSNRYGGSLGASLDVASSVSSSMDVLRYKPMEQTMYLGQQLQELRLSGALGTVDAAGAREEEMEEAENACFVAGGAALDGGAVAAPAGRSSMRRAYPDAEGYADEAEQPLEATSMLLPSGMQQQSMPESAHASAATGHMPAGGMPEAPQLLNEDVVHGGRSLAGPKPADKPWRKIGSRPATFAPAAAAGRMRLDDSSLPSITHADSQAAPDAAACRDTGSKSPAVKPVLQFKGFKPSHAKLLAALRKSRPTQPSSTAAPAAAAAASPAAGSGSGSGSGMQGPQARAVLHPGPVTAASAGARGGVKAGMAARGGWQAGHGAAATSPGVSLAVPDASLSPAQSHLYSPAVLMGSPRSAYTADTQVSALRAAAAHNGQAQPQQQQSAGQRGGMQQQGGQHSPSAGFCRQQLFSSSAHHSHIHAEALSHGPTDGGKNACIPERMAGGLSPQAHAGRDKPMHDVGHYLDVGQYADVGQCAGMEAGEVDARMGFPSAPQLNSTMLLAARMQHLSQIAAGGGPAPAVSAAAEAAVTAEAARRAANANANLPRDAVVYGGLPAVDYSAVQPAKASKQLHPGWVASRHARPELRAMWKPEEQMMEVCNTRGVSLYVRPTAMQLAQGLLDK